MMRIDDKARMMRVHDKAGDGERRLARPTTSQEMMRTDDKPGDDEDRRQGRGCLGPTTRQGMRVDDKARDDEDRHGRG